MSETTAAVLPFALKGSWIVTVESERHLVKVRHRTRWYAVARRKGHDDRRHWCASRADALGIGEYMRKAFERFAELERFKAVYNRLTAGQLAHVDANLAVLNGRETTP